MSKPKLYVVTKKPDEERPLVCGICGERFAKHQLASYDRHMAKCADSETAHRLEQHSPRKMFPFFGPDHGDVEYAEWFARRRRAILEGRIKP